MDVLNLLFNLRYQQRKQECSYISVQKVENNNTFTKDEPFGARFVDLLTQQRTKHPDDKNLDYLIMRGEMPNWNDLKTYIEQMIFTENQIRGSFQLFLRNTDSSCFYREGTSINLKSLITLNGKEWLNDDVINAYTAMCIRRFDVQDTPIHFCIDTGYVDKLKQNTDKLYEQFTKKQKLLPNEKVLGICIIPMNFQKNHWVLIVIVVHNNKARILYLDSLQNSVQQQMNFLNALKQTLMTKFTCTECFIISNSNSIQSDNYNCGVFVCNMINWITERERTSPGCFIKKFDKDGSLLYNTIFNEDVVETILKHNTRTQIQVEIFRDVLYDKNDDNLNWENNAQPLTTIASPTKKYKSTNNNGFKKL
jgi:Ulp1 protease family, C-terminal catalytic domain